MIAFVLGLDTTLQGHAMTASPHRDPADRRAGARARGALRAAPRRRERKTADPRPRTCDLIENGFNQLLEATAPDGVTTFGWDGNGNQTTNAVPGGETTQYTWDARDRLSAIALPDGTSAVYGYDTENLRVSMDDPDGARRILLDGLEEWGEVDEASGELTARFDHDPTRIDALLAQDSDAGRAAMLTDALGSVYGLADDGALIQAAYFYDAFGTRSTRFAGATTQWAFAGRPAVTGPVGLQYNRHRYYQAMLGRFLAEDPLNARTVDSLLLQSPSDRYSYAGANPSLITDPSGAAWEYFIISGLGQIGAGEFVEYLASGAVSVVGNYLTSRAVVSINAGAAARTLCPECVTAANASFRSWARVSVYKKTLAGLALGLRRLAPVEAARLGIRLAEAELELGTAAAAMLVWCPDVSAFFAGTFYETVIAFDIAAGLN